MFYPPGLSIHFLWTCFFLIRMRTIYTPEIYSNIWHRQYRYQKWWFGTCISTFQSWLFCVSMLDFRGVSHRQAGTLNKQPQGWKILELLAFLIFLFWCGYVHCSWFWSNWHPDRDDAGKAFQLSPPWSLMMLQKRRLSFLLYFLFTIDSVPFSRFWAGKLPRFKI